MIDSLPTLANSEIILTSGQNEEIILLFTSMQIFSPATAYTFVKIHIMYDYDYTRTGVLFTTSETTTLTLDWCKVENFKIRFIVNYGILILTNSVFSHNQTTLITARTFG